MAIGLSAAKPQNHRQIYWKIGTDGFLFNWLYNSDEPLVYLYGKGGSGKTTIAHEFASVVKRFGADIRIYQNESIDLVLFLSAKERRVLTGKDDSRVVSSEADFWDERSLYVNILRYSGLYTVLVNLVTKDLQA